MKKLIVLFLAVTLIVTASVGSISGFAAGESQIDKALSLINSFSTGDTKAAQNLLAKNYIQHNPAFGTGRDAFIAAVKGLASAPTKTTVRNIRAFEDDDYVFLHSVYNFAGAGEQVAFDIFRFEKGKIAEHWDNLASVAKPNPSGRSQISGRKTATDLQSTNQTKSIVSNFVRDVLRGKAPEKITSYIDGENYIQHNSDIADGLSGLNAALTAMAEAGIEMVYNKTHMVLGQGDFALAVSEGKFGGNHVAFYDLFRVHNGKIVEHWDIIETIPPQSEWANQNGKFLTPFNVVVKQIGNVKLHSFMSASVSPVIIESDKLVIIDFPGDSEENAALFKRYVDSLGKPIEQYFISHTDDAHWVGIEKQFPNMTFHSVDAKEIKAKDAGKSLSVTNIADGSTMTVAGVKMVFDVDRKIGAWMIKMPELKAAYVDHLGYVNLHVLLAPLEPRLTHLKQLDKEGYTWYMPGHGAPMKDPDFVKQVEAYHTDVLYAVSKYSTVEEAKAYIMKKWPNYVAPAMLDAMLPGLMK